MFTCTQEPDIQPILHIELATEKVKAFKVKKGKKSKITPMPFYQARRVIGRILEEKVIADGEQCADATHVHHVQPRAHY